MHQLAGVAQSVEQLTCNEKVEGSIPFSGTSNFGVWRSLVAHLVWDQGVQGSNPCTPTNSFAPQRARSAGFFVPAAFWRPRGRGAKMLVSCP